MGQRAPLWRSEADRQLWLAMLVDAMEEAARPEVRLRPCAPVILAGLHAQLSQPVTRFPFAAPALDLHN